MAVTLLRVTVLVICAAVLQATPASKSVAPVAQNAKRSRADEARIVAYAKQLDVRRLDPTLPKQQLDRWMRDIGAPASATQWVLSDCDLKDPALPAPLCVKFGVTQGRGTVVGLIEVGTQRDGVTGQARFLGMFLSIGLAEYLESASKLSDLPGLIARTKQSKRL